MTVPLQPRRQRRQLPPRGRRTGRPIRPAQARPDVGLARLRDEGVEVTRLVELAALNDRGVAEDIAQGLAQPLAAVDHPQRAPVEREPAGEQILQQLGADHGVLRRAQPQAQRDLAAVARDPQDHDHRLLRHHDAVHEQRHHLEPVQTPREVLLQPLPGPPHHGPTDAALATAPAGPPAPPPPRETVRPAPPARAHGPTRASAGAWSTSRRASAPPDAPASGPPHSPLAFAALSLFSSSLAAPWPRSWGPFVLVDAILTPTREPSLLSSQIQQGPGHLQSPPAEPFKA